MEVNLAIFIMAVGLLAMVALYPLAYREGRQSKDDVKAAAAADCILNTLTAALSSRNIKWEDWVNGIERADGLTGNNENSGRWLAYCDWEEDKDGSGGTFAPKSKGVINGKAGAVFDALAGINKDNKPSWPLDNNLACALVAQWGRMPVANVAIPPQDHSRVVIGVRVASRAGDILGQPIFYTEIHFQGDQEKLTE